MSLSGWCSGPAGARRKHEHCRSEVCSCSCHDMCCIPPNRCGECAQALAEFKAEMNKD